MLLQERTWVEAESLLGPDVVVAIPLGAGSKEHGPHLRLENDRLLAEHYKRAVLERADVVMLPTVDLSYYPAFTEYPGTITLSLETSRAVLLEVVRAIASHGPRRFYVLNTGVSTRHPLRQVRETLAGDGIALEFTDVLSVMRPLEAELGEQQGGTHADELETSMMLFIAPEAVDMSKAVTDFHPRGERGWLSRDPNTSETYSASGVWGDPTLATREKGRRVVEAMTARMLDDIEALRVRPLPRPPASTGGDAP